MKTRFGFAALFLLVLLGIGVSYGQQQQTQTHNGYWWTDQAQSFKLGFATGYAMAMTDASDAASFRCLAAKNGGTIPEKYPGDEMVTACLQAPEVVALNFGGLRIGQLVDGAEEFYKDFRNKSIEIQLTMRYVRDQLKGKSDKELTDELAAWRQSANK